ncbi:MAG: hypothetical protein K8I27_04765 [Planctomycetes bacterium]|nr:hypothetical protein [Planctomycetota bacterium]
MKYLIICLIAFSLTGCASLQRALETAERTRDAMEGAGVELRDAMEIAETAREKYMQALKEGDNNKVLAALTALQSAEDERRSRELRFDETRKAFDVAKTELERAKAQDSYLEGVLGLIIGGIVGGGGGFVTGRKRKDR